MFERLSELSGIPIQQLLPWRGTDNKCKPAYSYYQLATHSIHLPKFVSAKYLDSLITFLLSGPKTSTAQHEHIHSIIELLGSTPRKWPEELQQEDFADVGGYRWTGRIFLHRINSFYRKYGVDGLLSVFANTSKIETTRDLNALEKKLESDGYITPAGFTVKGISWFKTLAKKEDIERRLAKIKKIRKEERLSAE
ncbi:MAG: hypothetical protein PHD95_06655 [Candidatus ainarchaeum sp.]|nr:hypothetical protein [Candidatus ainarchaeum sp.]